MEGKSVMAAAKPTRPALRYLGGKWRLAPWIIEHLPPHDVYLEAFGGAASVLLQKPRAERETYNDLDAELVNLFSLLRADRGAELIRLVQLTPYARREFENAFVPAVDPLERARRLLVRSHMGFGTRGTNLCGSLGFRRDGLKGQTDVAGNWAGLDEELAAIAARFRHVTIEERPALDLLADFDAPEVLVYLDPPYLPETRSGKKKRGEGYHTYGHELTLADHHQLLDAIRAHRGSIILSGYASPLYDDALARWTRKTADARSHHNARRTEVLWINPRAAAGLAQQDLFRREAA